MNKSIQNELKNPRVDGRTDVVPNIRCVKTNVIDDKLNVISNHVNKSCNLFPKIRRGTNPVINSKFKNEAVSLKSGAYGIQFVR